MVSIETTTTTEDPKPCDEQPPVFDDITTPAPFETLTAPAHGEPEPLITVGDVDPAALPVPPVAVAPVVKKAATKKSNAESKEGPMGELRPTDILAGNYRKRAGNYLYKKLLREHAPDVGKIEMKLLVSKVVEGIAGQTPPGTCTVVTDLWCIAFYHCNHRLDSLIRNFSLLTVNNRSIYS